MQPSESGQISNWLSLALQFSRQLRRELAERYSSFGLNESRAAVLEVLSQQSRRRTQADLAHELSLSESNLCALIEHMRQEGLLCRERSDLDRRKTLLSVTPLGQERFQVLQEIHVQLEQTLAKRLPSALMATLPVILEELRLAVQELPPAAAVHREVA